MSDEQQLDNIVFLLEELFEDDTVPRNVRAKLQSVKKVLTGPEELAIKKNKALQMVTDVNDDSNLKSFSRDQILLVLSELEAL